MGQEEEAYALKHFGVKGMHWGVRHDRGTSGQGGSGANSGNLTGHDKAVLKAAGLSPKQSATMDAKYGPDSQKEGHHLTPAQKKAIIYGAVGVAVVGVGIYAYKSGGTEATVNRLVKGGIGKPTAEFLVKSDATKGAHAKSLTGFNFEREDLSFEPGHIFSRVSTEAEKTIRPEGFYAAHLPKDVERYKAVLPVYWKMWASTAGKTSGYVNHYASDSHLRVASEKTLLEMVRKSLDDPIINSVTLRQKLSSGYLGRGAKNDEELIRKTFAQVAAGFIDPKDPVTAHLTKLLQASGYHGVIDANDAGSLGESPVKFLAGGLFKIVGHDVLTAEHIKIAQDGIVGIGHSDEDLADFIAHFGVKGMHWGEHRARSQAASDANEHIKAKLFYGEGAGTRRKLIKAKVETRSKNPVYKKAFDAHVAKQNLEKRAAQATRTRRRKDATHFVGKTTRGVHRSLTGGFGPVTVTAATIAAGAAYLHSSGADKILIQKVSNLAHNPSAQASVKAWMRAAGAG